LLKLLLNKGVSASATTLHSISEGWPPEQCTALIWALSSKPRVDNEVVRTLLERGGEAALPACSTPLKEVSAAFLCLLDRSRTDILKALLRLDKNGVLSYEIPGRSFEHLAISPAVSDPSSSDFTGRLPLHLAALFLGNFDAFRLVGGSRFPNDGLLHNAAFFALPEFVEWCLRTDDPNARDENFDGRIPLAVACDAKHMPCCKIGNERDFRTRQRETMEKLAPRSDLKYREKHKTILHIALHSGPETTAAMLDALNVVSDSNKHTEYRYTDQEGRQYSPREYVMEIMGCEPEQKEALVACLSKAGFDAVPGSWR
jgi:ankyrin repeat protein